MADCPLPLTVQESPGRVRLCLGSLAHGDGPTLQDAAADLATMDFLYRLGEIAAAGGDIRSHVFG